MRARDHLAGVVQLVGLGALVYGLYEMWAPLAFIAVAGFLIYLGERLAK